MFRHEKNPNSQRELEDSIGTSNTHEQYLGRKERRNFQDGTQTRPLEEENNQEHKRSERRLPQTEPTKNIHMPEQTVNQYKSLNVMFENLEMQSNNQKVKTLENQGNMDHQKNNAYRRMAGY